MATKNDVAGDDDGKDDPVRSTNQTHHEAVYVVVCSSRDPRSESFVHHLKQQQYRVITRDCSLVWEHQTGARFRQWWGFRLMHYKNATRSVPDGALVVFLDSYDILVLRSAAATASRFRRLNAPLAFQCTMTTWPPVERCPAYRDIRSPYADIVPGRLSAKGWVGHCQYPCGGAYMGTKAAIGDLFSHIPSDISIDDQCWLHETLSTKFTANKDWVLDYNATVFLELVSMSRQEIENFFYGLPSSEFYPAFVHLDSLHPDFQQVESFYEQARKSGVAHELLRLLPGNAST
eukprot:TRINITY_DN2423_c0_g1_i3.p1 TRINITY_DN2423_c0_g1~~TRINITY_DN2423_c0_g1_i3.p1  ORF type:complete len:334 (-),score=28.31 TRINITY_DN2423_c0_g1_i3:73-942(-)